MKRPILIVSFTLPPYPGIGGRRWAKFIKALSRDGFQVIGLAAKEGRIKEISKWQSDITNPKATVFYINSSYPNFLGIKPITVVEKVLYRIAKACAKVKVMGNFYDKSKHWEVALLKKCKEIIIDNNIGNLICTVPPFATASFICKLKSSFDNLNLIIDYRDPWSNNRNSFGVTTLSMRRLKFEIKAEKKVLELADKITVVSAEMSVYLAELGGVGVRKKITHLPNGFDADDYQEVGQDIKMDSGFINIVFAGTFYDKTIHLFKALYYALIDVAKSDFKGSKELKFYFAGTIPDEVRGLMRLQPQHFVFLGQLSLAQTYTLLKQATYCAVFLPDDIQYSLSTKFYEYLVARRPILSFSSEAGFNASFLEKNRVGRGIEISNIRELLYDLMLGKEILDFDSDFDVSPYELNVIVKKLEDLLV